MTTGSVLKTPNNSSKNFPSLRKKMVAVRNDRSIQSFNFRPLVRFRLLVRQGNAALCFVAERDGGNEEFLLSIPRRFLALQGGSVSLCVANLRGEDFAGFLACCRFVSWFHWVILGRPVQLGYETKIYQAARCPNHNGFGRQLSFLDISSALYSRSDSGPYPRRRKRYL